MPQLRRAAARRKRSVPSGTTNHATGIDALPRSSQGRECREDTGFGEGARCGKRFVELEYATRAVKRRD